MGILSRSQRPAPPVRPGPGSPSGTLAGNKLGAPQSNLNNSGQDASFPGLMRMPSRPRRLVGCGGKSWQGAELEQRSPVSKRVTRGLIGLLMSVLLSCHSVFAMAVCSCSEPGVFHSHELEVEGGAWSHDHPGHSNLSTVFHAHPSDSTDDCNHAELAEMQLASLSKRGTCVQHVTPASAGWNPQVSLRACDGIGAHQSEAFYDVGRHWFVSVGTVVLRL